MHHLKILQLLTIPPCLPHKVHPVAHIPVLVPVPAPLLPAAVPTTAHAPAPEASAGKTSPETQTTVIVATTNAWNGATGSGIPATKIEIGIAIETASKTFTETVTTGGIEMMTATEIEMRVGIGEERDLDRAIEWMNVEMRGKGVHSMR